MTYKIIISHINGVFNIITVSVQKDFWIYRIKAVLTIVRKKGKLNISVFIFI